MCRPLNVFLGRKVLGGVLEKRGGEFDFRESECVSMERFHMHLAVLFKWLFVTCSNVLT